MDIVKYRKYCKHCGDYTLHNKIDGKDEFICNKCSNLYVKVPIEEIPEDVKQRQQDRYKDKNARDFNRITPYTLSGFSRDYDFLSEPTAKQTIVESDAGYRKKRYLESREYQKNFLIYEQLSEYKNNLLKITHRNDKCPCGSNIKFKKCCLLHPEKEFKIDVEKLKSDLQKWSDYYLRIIN